MNFHLMTRSASMLLVVALSSCLAMLTNEGRDFDPTIRKSFVLKSTQQNEVIRSLGNPATVEKKIIGGSTHEIIVYQYWKTDVAADFSFDPDVNKHFHGRVLRVEFRDSVLNGYLFMSSFSEDMTTVDTAKMFNIRLGKSTESDVLALLGEPHGKLLLPSSWAESISPSKVNHILQYRGFQFDEKSNKMILHSVDFLVDSTAIIRDVLGGSRPLVDN